MDVKGMFSVTADVDGVRHTRQRGKHLMPIGPTGSSRQPSRVDTNTVSISQRRKLRQENDAVVAQGWRPNRQ